MVGWERRVVRVGVLVIAAAAALALVCSALPGYQLTEYDRSHCDDSFDFWGHSSHVNEPCFAEISDKGTEPAGTLPLAFAILMMSLPGIWVWQRGTARSALVWGGCIWLAAIGLLAFAILTYESSSDGCGNGVEIVRHPLWPTYVVGAGTAAVFFGPMLLAAISFATRWSTKPKS